MGVSAQAFEQGDRFAFAFLEGGGDVGRGFLVGGDEDAGEGVAAALGFAQFTGEAEHGGFEFRVTGEEG